ncbi:MAG: SHOCT domain-containing protein [bacterium]|nr:SHOCT domain-containing protein [bacterium]
MKKIFSLTVLAFSLNLVFSPLSFAQGMMDTSNTVSPGDDGHTAREEAEGKEIWEKLQAKELSCKDLSDDKFGALGEYFMGRMMGNSHESMNTMMTQMMGEEEEEQMHVAMGKRMSNCEPNATMPQSMMNGGMMENDWNSSALTHFSNPMSMMNFGFAPFGWVFMILFWGLVIFGIVTLVKWSMNQNKGESKSDKSALEILKGRYAKGEINKKEFEEKKKDLK